MKRKNTIFQNEKFNDAYKKLCIGVELTEKEKEYILGAAILLIKKYLQNINNKNYQYLYEIAYQIILNYSIVTNDYKPLNYFSFDFGLFPIVRFINNHDLIENCNICQILYNLSLDKYKNEDYIETYEQNRIRNNIINSDGNFCLIAPTSYGKSSLISQHIIHRNNKKVLIIVPKKSLLFQTYINIRKKINDRKVICHNDMYDKNCKDGFVAVLTQERAMRLFEKNIDLNIDCLYIDEAHNLFNNDSRCVVLSRVIRTCIKRNTETKIVYMSPFVSNIKNLYLKNQNFREDIKEHRVLNNVKEPRIYLCNGNGKISLFNRFSKEFYEIKQGYDYKKYILEFSKKKNYVFINKPSRIEEFAIDLYGFTDEINVTNEIIRLKETISKNVHKDFLINKLIDHGIVYLHAKIPDMLKDYIEHKFKVIPELKYIVANSVILEGINLPIDNLFIIDAYSQRGSDLQNLIGRVNRLNNVFDNKNTNLEKLCPDVHFIDSPFYNYKMINKIEKLYANNEDEVLNPLLNNYSLNNIKNKTKKQKIKIINENNIIIKNEEIYFREPYDEFERLKQILIKTGMQKFISLDNNNINNIALKINNKFVNFSSDSKVIDKVKYYLVEGINIIDNSYKRLANEKTINYYKMFLSSLQTGNLKKIIEEQYKYFIIQKGKGNYMYIGKEFGECKGPYENDLKHGKVYIDLKTKSEIDLINLIIKKIKIEQDFISFQYMRAVDFLYETLLISENEYNMELYGTNDENEIKLLRLGLLPYIYKLLKNNNQIKNIRFDKNGNPTCNDELKSFYYTLDDYSKFEMSKFIDFN